MAQVAGTPATAHVDTSGSPYGVILRLAAPTVVAMLTQSIVNEIDIIFFAHLPCPESSNGQAALLPSLILLWVFGGSLSAISVGTQVFTARRFAERRHADAGAVLVNAVCFASMAGVLFTILGYFVVPLLLGALKVSGVRDAASGYLRWRLLGITSMAVTFAFKAFFDGIGKTHVHLVSAVVMNILNVVLCYAFIFGNWGAPRMGVSGAGFAAAVSTYVGLFIMIGYALLPRYRAYRLFDLRRYSKAVTSGYPLLWPATRSRSSAARRPPIPPRIPRRRASRLTALFVCRESWRLPRAWTSGRSLNSCARTPGNQPTRRTADSRVKSWATPSWSRWKKAAA